MDGIENIVLTCASHALGLIIIDRLGYFNLTVILAYTFAFALGALFFCASAPSMTRITKNTIKRKKAHVHD